MLHLVLQPKIVGIHVIIKYELIDKEGKMTQAIHLDNLNHKHDKIDEQIADAYLHHAADENVISLKKKRLMLEDEIARFMAKLDNQSIHEIN